MKVIEMGNLGLADGMTGLLIEANKTELQEMANLLYEDVEVVAVGGEQQADNSKVGRKKTAKRKKGLEQYFEDLVLRAHEVRKMMAADLSQVYDVGKVDKILDYLLDGIGNLPKGSAKTAGESEVSK